MKIKEVMKRVIETDIFIVMLLFIVAAGIISFCKKPIESNSETASSSSGGSAISENLFANDPWYTLCHDAQRTSASPDGDITALTEMWAVKAGTSSYRGGAGWAIGDDINLYYGYSDWSSANSGTGDYFALNKYDVNGTLIWANRRLGVNHCNHLSQSKIGGWIVYGEDRIAKVSESGSHVNMGCYDCFGQIVPNPDNNRFYSATMGTMEGGARMTAKAWSVLQFIRPGTSNYSYQVWETEGCSTSYTGNDENRGAIAYDNGKIFIAARYLIGSGTFCKSNGIYALDTSNITTYIGGAQLWYQATTPTGSGISAGNNRVYSVENTTSLVARNQSDGTVSWSQTITGTNANGQPPVLAGSLVIIATSSGVYTYDATTGTPGWNTPLSNIRVTTLSRNDECTVMAAAMGSNTLIVTADDGVRILDLTDGSIDLFYDPPSIVNRPVNPIIIGSRVYVSDGNSAMTPTANKAYSEFRMVCLQSGGSPPPPDVTPPTLTSGITFTNVTNSSITTNWTAATDNVSVAYYNEYYRQQGASSWIPVNTTSLANTFNNLLANTTYEFYYNAVDVSGNVSSNSSTATQATTANSSNPSTQLMGSVIYSSATGQRTLHNFNWTAVESGVTQALQRKTSSTSYVTIYSGTDNFYAYDQPDLKTTYTYRVLLNGTYPSNEIQLRSKRR